MTSKLQAAVGYAKSGFFVIPCINKRPIIKFADIERPTPEKVRQMWLRNPEADIAIKTDKFFVVDVDRGHGSGVDGVASLKELPKEWFPKTTTQSTKHGGFQMFYKKPKNARMTQVIGFRDGIDIKAHNNNYVMVAPSTGYTWQIKGAMAKASKGLLNAIDLRLINQRAFQRMGYVSTGERKRTKTTEILETIVNGLGTQGMRNNNLASFIGSILATGIDEDTAWTLCQITNANGADPLSEKELTATFNSITKAEVRNYGSGS